MPERVKMRHPELSKKRKTDVTIDVHPRQVPVHQQSGWVEVKAAAGGTSEGK